MINIAPHIIEALKKGFPVVALESTIISHGMPYPDNVKTAIRVEKIIKNFNVVPATIGIIDGVAVIGMNHEQIEQFGKRDGICKVSRHNLPVIYAKKQWGATTVAATMMLAEQAGIEIFVTGGIGGVHRDARLSFDISADLEELAQTNVTVVCAGAKSILDIGATLQYLETKGVPVIGYKTNNFPGFYVRDSGHRLHTTANDVKTIANIIKQKRNEKITGGIVVANPVSEDHELPSKLIERIIEKALVKAKKNNIQGLEVTPFLLQEINEQTEGESLKTNIALVLQNARLGALIARELNKE
jgi:pseudouridylate synthase